MPSHVFTDLIVTQSYNTDSKYLITGKINGTKCEEVINNDVKEFENVTKYASDPWFITASAVFKGSRFENLSNGKK